MKRIYLLLSGSFLGCGVELLAHSDLVTIEIGLRIPLSLLGSGEPALSVVVSIFVPSAFHLSPYLFLV